MTARCWLFLRCETRDGVDCPWVVSKLKMGLFANKLCNILQKELLRGVDRALCLPAAFK
jgi:hypothetical protein